jgi:WD40 repeat protein/serine/threonine protein kinase
MTADKQSKSEPHGPLQQVIADYLQSEASGRPVERAQLLANHPELADELQAFFADHDQARAWAEPLCVPVARRPSPERQAATIGPAEGGPADLQLGTIIRYFGDYELLAEIARGGMGVVYKARQVKLQRIVAVKMILAGELANQTDVERFLTEARAAAHLHHPNIVAIHEVGQHAGQHYFSMDYVAGESLANKIARGPLPVREAATLVMKVAQAVSFAHVEGVIHRDLKPANILLDAKGEPRVTDFGLAKRIQGEPGAVATGLDLTQTGQVLGTPSYMPPEQAAGKTKDIGSRSDVYSLGAVLYCALTGHPPFQAASTLDTLLQVLDREPVPPRTLNSAVPRDLETICLKCLAKEPRKRYPSAQELAADLDRFLTGQPIQARRIGPVGQSWRWCRRNPTLAAASALAGAGLLSTAVLGIFFAIHQSRAADHNRLMLAESYLEKGQNLCEDGDVARGMLWIARSLETAPNSAPELQRAIRANLGAWSPSPAGLRTSLTLQNGVSVIAFSADGKLFMTEEGTQTALFWETGTLKPLGKVHHSHLNSGNTPSKTVVFNPDGTTFATECYDVNTGAVAQLWDVAGGHVLRRFVHPPSASGDKPSGNTYAICLAFSRDGKTLVTVDHNKGVLFWEVATGKYIGPPLPAEMGKLHTDWIEAVAISPDNQIVATGSRDNTVRLWDTTTGKPMGPPLPHEGWVRAIVFSPEGKTILTGSLDGNARIWDVATGKLVGAPFALGGQNSNSRGGVAVAYSPDGSMILTAAGHDARYWDTASQQPIGQPLRHQNDVFSVAFSPEGKTVLTGSMDSTARLWDVPDRKPAEIQLVHKYPVTAAAFSPIGNLVGTGSQEIKIITQVNQAAVTEARLWDAVSGQPLGDPLPNQPNMGWPRHAAFSPDGKLFAMLSEFWDFKNGGRSRSVIHLWDVATRQPIGQPMVQTVDGSDWAAGLERLAFAADGKTLIATDRQALTQVWDVATGQPIGLPVKVDMAMTRPQAFSPDGKRVLCGHGHDNTGVLENAVKGDKKLGEGIGIVSDGYVVMGILQHKGSVEAVAFSPDGTLLLTGSDDKTARLWDAATQKPIGPPMKHAGPVRTVAFSADSKMVLTASLDKTVRIWHVPPVAEGATKRLVLWPEVVTGMKIWGGGLYVLSADEWLKRKRDLEQLGGPPLP